MDTVAAAPPALHVAGIDHFTVRCRADEIDTLRDFYGDVLGLQPGPRPAFPFPGYWLYIGDSPTIHIAGSLTPEAPGGQPGQTGRLDHVSFAAHDADAVHAHLNARGIAYRGTPVPGFPLYQLFFHDPVGVKIELTFRTDR